MFMAKMKSIRKIWSAIFSATTSVWLRAQLLEFFGSKAYSEYNTFSSYMDDVHFALHSIKALLQEFDPVALKAADADVYASIKDRIEVLHKSASMSLSGGADVFTSFHATHLEYILFKPFSGAASFSYTIFSNILHVFDYIINNMPDSFDNDHDKSTMRSLLTIIDCLYVCTPAGKVDLITYYREMSQYYSR